MFGYISVSKEQMKEEDYLDFCSYYCGVCKAMGKYCSNLSRLGLSYDVTFLAMVLSAVMEDDMDSSEERCIAHWFKKRQCYRNSTAIDYTANMGMLLIYLKLLDDWRDERSIRAAFGMIMLYRGLKRAKKRYPKQYEHIDKQLKKLNGLEKQGCGSIDEAADCFAVILETLFTPELIHDENTRRILKWIGYNTGRWIYIIDAVNDMEKDHHKSRYNALNIAFQGGVYDDFRIKTANAQRTSLLFTLENIASGFELLDIRKKHGALEHIIYNSLIYKQNSILGEE